MKLYGTGIFENLWGALRIAFALMTPFLRSRRVWKGCTATERSLTLPGDELTPDLNWRYVHAVTINAPVGAVWPWVAQIGQGRGGFYSYQRLENIAGCRIVNADRIIPELQDIRLGDGIRLHPDMPPLRVVVLEPGRALILQGCMNMKSGQQWDPADRPFPDGVANVTWAFVLAEAPDGGCRLYSTNRVEYGPGRMTAISNGPTFVEPVSYVMDVKMLDGIKRRATA